MMHHCMLLIGYGELESQRHYWKLKNSLVIEWGTEGFVLMALNTENDIGLTMMAIIPFYNQSHTIPEKEPDMKRKKI